MYSHITLGTNDIECATAFYRAVLPIVGLGDCRDYSEQGLIGFAKGTGAHSEFFICKPLDGNPATVGNGLTVGFAVESRRQVDAFYDEAIKMGAKDEGPPGLRPHYHPDYYGAYVRDLDGHKLCCVCQEPE